jgi:hypothetical protein
MTCTDHPIDGALLRFHRDSLTNVLRRGPSTAALRRAAPRALQIGLLTPCNLRCGFCYRDAHAPSRLTAPFLVDLLARAVRPPSPATRPELPFACATASYDLPGICWKRSRDGARKRLHPTLQQA